MTPIRGQSPEAAGKIPSVPAASLAGCTCWRAGFVRPFLTGWTCCKGGVWLHETTELPPSHRHPTAFPANSGRSRWRRTATGYCQKASHTVLHTLSFHAEHFAQVTVQCSRLPRWTSIVLAHWRFDDKSPRCPRLARDTYMLLGAGITNIFSLDASCFCRSSTLNLCCSFVSHRLLLVLPSVIYKRVDRQRQKLVL